MNKIAEIPNFLSSMQSLGLVGISNNPFTSELPGNVSHSGTFLQHMLKEKREEAVPIILGAPEAKIIIPQGYMLLRPFLKFSSFSGTQTIPNCTPICLFLDF
jgi:hypothetical protein